MHPGKLLVSALILLMGLGVGIFGAMKVFEASGTESWSPVQAESLEATAVRMTGSKRTYPYEVRVRYAYEFGESAYEGDRYDIHGAYKAGSAADAESKTRAWAPGTLLTVLVDPDDPEVSVLKSGGGGKAWLMVVMGGLLALAGVFAGLKKR